MKPYGWLLILMSISFIAVPRIADAKDAYIFSAPPRESLEDGIKQYGAIAAYLSRVTGKEIRYVHQTNWISYMQGMKNGEYDIVFDGPHFNVWRTRYLGHLPLARIDNLEGKRFKPKWFLVYRKAEWNRDVTSLPGRKFCLHAPPNFGTMSALHILFPDPSRQPYIDEMKGWKKMVKAVYNKEHGCEFTVSRGKHIKDVDPEGKVLGKYAFAEFYNQGFTVSAALPEDMIEKIKVALPSEGLRKHAAPFFRRFVKTEKRGLVLYKDSHEYDMPLEIFAKEYLEPWHLLNNTFAARP